MSLSFAAASIVMLPELVVSKIAASPIVRSSAAVEEPMYVFRSEAGISLVVPPSFTIKPSASASVIEPVAVPPSIKLISAAVASMAANFVKSACTSPETPSK